MELFSAIDGRETAQIARLLAAGADVNFVEPFSGVSVLHHYVKNGATGEQIQQFLDRGANPNVPNSRTRETPLFAAVATQNLSAIDTLLRGGANPNVEEKRGNTPLGNAVHVQNPEMVRRLLAGGADPNGDHNYGHILGKALQGSTRRANEILRILLAAGSDPNATTLTQNGEIHVLLYAIINSKLEAVRLLLAAGANPNTVDTYIGQETYPLYEAVDAENVEMVQLLANAGAYKEPHGFEGRVRALAANLENTEIVRILAAARRRHALDAFATASRSRRTLRAPRRARRARRTRCH